MSRQFFENLSDFHVRMNFVTEWSVAEWSYKISPPVAPTYAATANAAENTSQGYLLSRL